MKLLERMMLRVFLGPQPNIIGTGLGLLIGGLAAAGGSVAGGALASSGAKSAANAQAAAEQQAANLQYRLGEDQLGFDRGVYGNELSAISPLINTGYSGLANLAYLAGVLPGSSGTNAGIPSFSGTGATAQVPLNGLLNPDTIQNVNAGGALPGSNADPFAKYQGRTFDDLIHSGDPWVSPNIETSRAWEAQGIPQKIITSSDGRSVGVRTDMLPSANASAPSLTDSGINVPKDLGSLVNPGIGEFGSLMKPFEAPTNVTEQNDPGYKFRLQAGLDALTNSAAARGGLLSGGSAKALEDYAQNSASNEYGNVYNRAFNTFQTNRSNTINLLSTLAGFGPTSTAQLINSGNAAENATGNTTAALGSQVGSSLSGAGAARASGYLNSGNIWGNTASSIGSNLGLLALLAGQKPQSPGGYYPVLPQA